MKLAPMAVWMFCGLTAVRALAQDAQVPPPPDPAIANSSEAAASSTAGESSETARPLELNGFVRADAFVPTKRDKDPFNFLGGTFMLKVAPSFGSKADAFGEVRLIADEAAREVSLDLREAYADLYLGPVDIRLGRQIIVWGRADGINPTDNLCGKDMTIFSPDEDDRRLGAYALKVDLRLPPVKLTGVLIPVFRPSQLLLGTLPSFVTLKDSDNPAPDVRHMGGAVKLDFSLSSIDFSVSYFNGYGPFPGIELVQLIIMDPGPPQVDLRFTYDRRHVFGADFAWQVLGIILRGEAAYVLTDYESRKTPQMEQSYATYVLGVEATPIESLSILVQFIQKVIPDYESAEEAYPDPSQQLVAMNNSLYHRQQKDHLESISARIAYSMLQETLKFELLGVYNFHEEDYLIRPMISYAFNDAITGILGGEIYEGPDASLFGQLDEYSSVFIEAKYSF